MLARRAEEWEWGARKVLRSALRSIFFSEFYTRAMDFVVKERLLVIVTQGAQALFHAKKLYSLFRCFVTIR